MSSSFEGIKQRKRDANQVVQSKTGGGGEIENTHNNTVKKN